MGILIKLAQSLQLTDRITDLISYLMKNIHGRKISMKSANQQYQSSTAALTQNSSAGLNTGRFAGLNTGRFAALTQNSGAGLLFGSAALSAYCFLVMPQPALAYFDLGFGTYLIQLICGFGAAIWLSFVTRVRKKKKGQNSESKIQAADNPADGPEQSALTQKDPAGESSDKSVNLAGESEK